MTSYLGYLYEYYETCTSFILFSTFRLAFYMLLIDKLLLQIYFGRNMHKNALFLLKNSKNRLVLGISPSDSPLRIPGYATATNEIQTENFTDVQGVTVVKDSLEGDPQAIKS